MPKAVHADILAAAQKREIQPVFMLDILTDPPIRLCSTQNNLPTPFGEYLGAVLSHLESFAEDNQLQNQNMRFAVAGNDGQWLSDALQSNLIGVSCDLYLGILGAGRGVDAVGTGGSLMANSRSWMFSGEIDSCEIVDDSEATRLMYTVENFVYALARSPGARHTDGFQRIKDPLDMSHAMVGQLAMKNLGVRQ
jgi:hypothetical protein